MSFDHRFGVGVGGSYEDPFTHPLCDDCNPDDESNKCPCEAMNKWLEAEDKARAEFAQEPPVPEDQGLDEMWEREI